MKQWILSALFVLAMLISLFSAWLHGDTVWLAVSLLCFSSALLQFPRRWYR